MILGLTALVLLAMFASVGYGQGAVRASMSFLGIIAGAVLAMPLAPYLNPLWNTWKIHTPWARELFGPISVFLVIWIVFQIIAHSINQKVELFFRYKVGEKRFYKWERLNVRLGFSIGLLNGAAFFVLLLVPIFIFGYLTVQCASGNEDPASLRLLNKARLEMQQTKLDKVAAAYAPARPAVYETFDVLGLIYKNPLSETLLARYPSFLTLAERPEFQELANDPKFHDLWQRGSTISEMVRYPSVQAIITNASHMANIKQVLGPDLHDLHEFLKTQKSEKYGEIRILGRWVLNYNETKERSRAAGVDMKKMNPRLVPFWGAALLVTTDNRAILKRSDQVPGSEHLPRNMADGAWRKEAGLYQFAFENKSSDVVFEGDDRIIFPYQGMTLIFDREM